MTTPSKPYPGSSQAKQEGCKCPIIDNHHGKGRGGDGPKFGWYVRGDCPLHQEQSNDD